MPKPAPSAQACTAGSTWLNSRLPLTGTREARGPGPGSRPCRRAGDERMQLASLQVARMFRRAVPAQQSGWATTTRRILPSGWATSEESSSLPMRMPRSMPSSSRLTTRSSSTTLQRICGVALREAGDGGRHVHLAEQHRRGDGEVARGLGRAGAERGSDSSTAASTWRQRSRCCRPSSVSEMRRVVRLNRRTPSCGLVGRQRAHHGGQRGAEHRGRGR